MMRCVMCVVMAVLLPVLSATAGQNMIGRQSQNEGVVVAPAPGSVTIDGSLNDWDTSGRIWVFADKDIRSRFSGEIAAMWDKDNLYLSIQWRDPTPMFSDINPAFNPSSGWKADSVQMRVKVGAQPIWITTWYYTAAKQPVMHLAYWKNPARDKDGVDELMLLAAPGGTDLGHDAAMAYRKDADETGYVQEMRIPWKLLFRDKAVSVEPGLKIQCGFELLWGDPTGSKFPIHRYADNMQPGTTSREFFWTAQKAWGDLALTDKGNVEPRVYVSDEGRIEGTLPIRVTVPKSAARVTLAINDAAGRRVRNLAGDILPEDYAVADTADTRTLEIKWDGMDDQGALVSPGKYQVVGLSHGGLGAEYEMCFYNPGTPPWETKEGHGAWGADHCAPLRTARAGDWMIVSWPFAEGGSGILGIGPDGMKKWGEKRGAEHLAADDRYVYAIPSGWHIKEHALMRLGRDKGDYQPFVKDGQPRPLELPIRAIVGDDKHEPAGLAASNTQLVMLLRQKSEGSGPAKRPSDLERQKQVQTSNCRIVWLDKTTADMVKSIDTPPLVGIAATPAGDVYAIDRHTVYALKGDKLEGLVGGLGDLTAVTVDNKGRVLVTDTGPDQQVKAFSADGKPAYTCGVKAGRPLHGVFNPQAMSHMSSVAVDSKDQVWVVESWNFPRRVSVWNPADGTLVRDYIGNTGYAGTGSMLHDQRPDTAYVGPIEIKLNKQDRSWRVSRVLWVPDPAKNESFDIDSGSHVGGRFFNAEIAGKRHEYFFQSPYRNASGYVVFMERGDSYLPVAAVTTVARICDALNSKGQFEGELRPEFSDCDPFDAVYWNDTNRDGAVQRDECQIVKATPQKNRRTEIPIPMGSGWGTRCADDLSFFVNGVYKYTPLRYDPDGAPVFGPESLAQKLCDEFGDFVPVLDQNTLLCLSFKGNPRPAVVCGIDTQSGDLKWSYPNPYPGVHGSHRATMPKPGLIIGPLEICGIADLGPQAGKVFLMRGNLGQDFLMTTDGLYVGAMFNDGRIPNESLPPKEEQLIGRPMEAFSHGGEPFNGWFGRQSDGVVRMTTGFPRQAAMILRVTGLPSIQRYTGPTLDVSAAGIAQTDKDNQVRASREAGPKQYTIAPVATPPVINANDNDWESQPRIDIRRAGFPFTGSARITYDADNLYLFYQVEDASPWVNEGKDFTRLFKTGDAVDLQLCVDPAKHGDKRRDPGPGDLRVVISQLGGKPVAVLMRPVDPSAPRELARQYQSPVGTKMFDRVEVLKQANIKVRTFSGGYAVEAAIPLGAIGFQPATGMTLRGDVGFISSDQQGTINTARTYWANPNTNLVNDLPLEAWMTPHEWGTLVVE